jgi:hypothetical protein
MDPWLIGGGWVALIAAVFGLVWLLDTLHVLPK